MVLFIFLFAGISIFGTTDALECFGHACSTNQYCLIQLGSKTGNCYTHHGHGHHEDHQLCIGSHHPGNHCYCLDENCVNIMERNFGQTTEAPLTTAMMGSSAMMGSTDMMKSSSMGSTDMLGLSEETTTVALAPTTTISIQFLQCFGNSCIAPLKVCKIKFEKGVAASGTCEQPSSSLLDCGPTITNGDCQCKTNACINTLCESFNYRAK